jgi:hypothetical protein
MALGSEDCGSRHALFQPLTLARWGITSIPLGRGVGDGIAANAEAAYLRETHRSIVN